MSFRFRIMLSGACALLGVVCCLAYAQQVRAEAERTRAEVLERFGGEVVALVVARQALEPGDVVGEGMVALRDWASDLAPEGALRGLDEVLGREVRNPVAAGQPLTELAFRDEAGMAEVPEGHVAVSVPVTERLGVARQVARGTRLAAYALGEGGPELIAGDVEVLCDLGQAAGMVATPQLTIAVLPGEVEALLAASATGELRLVMPAPDMEGAEAVGAPAEGQAAAEDPDGPASGPPEELEVADAGTDAGTDADAEASAAPAEGSPPAAPAQEGGEDEAATGGDGDV